MVHFLKVELETCVNRWKMKPVGAVWFQLIDAGETALDQCVYFKLVSLHLLYQHILFIFLFRGNMIICVGDRQ